MKGPVGSKFDSAEVREPPTGPKWSSRSGVRAEGRDVIAVVVGLSGILYLSIDARFAQIAIITNNSWGGGLHMPPVYLGQNAISERLCSV